MAEKPIPQYSGQWWVSQLDRDEKALRDGWWNYADKIVKKYLAKKNEETDEYWINLFWSNVGIMKAALYAQPPKPMVKRSFEDPNDGVARVAAQILQRALSQDLMKNNSPMHEAIKLAVEDRLIPGLGQIWLRYEPTIETKTTPAVPHPLDPTQDLVPEQEYDEITHEEVCTEYVPWRDFVFPAARVASELWYVARKLYLTPADVKKRFGARIAGKISDTVGDKQTRIDGILPKNFTKDKVEIYEIWCKKNRKVYWVSRHVTDNLLGSADDPLDLEDFYPCPMPLMATHTTNDYKPRPDFYMLKDQYDQLNDLNTRIVLLEHALRVVGVYNKKNDALKSMLSDAKENDMIAVDNWAMFAEQGGMKGAVDWFPLEQVALVLEKLQAQLQTKIDQIYVLTGISDIMRGDTNARETLGAQEMKADFSSARLQYLQSEVGVFVREALIIKSEIMTKHFQDETLIAMSGMDQSFDAQMLPAAIALLRDSDKSTFRIDINEEGLALPNYTRESANRQEFLKVMGQFMSQASPLAQELPGTMPYLIQVMRWVASSLKGAGEIQGIMDQMFQAAVQGAQQKASQPPPPDPKVQVQQLKNQDNQFSKMAEGQMAKGQDAAKAAETAQSNATQLLVVQQEGLNAAKERHLDLSSDLVSARLDHLQRMDQIAAQQDGGEGD
jgi:hypothetical protein